MHLRDETDILLMDEAFSALDPLIRKDMQDYLLEIQEKMERTIIFITHDLDEALRIGDRIVLMKDGSVVQVGTPEEIMTNPANDYVERFVEDVNVAKVYTAESVMNRAESITVDRGPRVALKIMQEAGYSSIYVVDKKKTLLGVVTADDISRAIKQDKLTADVLDTDIPTVTTDTLLENLYDKMVISRFPLPVVDENHRLRGIIKKERVIEALAGTDSNEVNVNE